jgi:hypothetical protein
VRNSILAVELFKIKLPLRPDLLDVAPVALFVDLLDEFNIIALSTHFTSTGSPGIQILSNQGSSGP